MADEDRRTEARATKSVRAGLIRYDDPARIEIDCVLLDLSVTGAQLDALGAVGVPDTFRLLVQAERLNRGAVSCGATATGSACGSSVEFSARSAVSDAVLGNVVLTC